MNLAVYSDPSQINTEKLMTNKQTYSLETKPAVKHVITITAKQLYRNYMLSMIDLIWDRPNESVYESCKDTIDVLTSVSYFTDPEAARRLRKLFKQGETYLLVGDAIGDIDTGRDDVLVEIQIIQNGDYSNKVVIEHGDIYY